MTMATQWLLKCRKNRICHISPYGSTVPFRPSVQSRVTNDFELSTSGVSSWVTSRHELTLNGLNLPMASSFLHEEKFDMTGPK